MQTNDTRLQDSNGDGGRKRRSGLAFALGALAAFAVAGALGLGFMLGTQHQGEEASARSKADASATPTPGEPTVAAVPSSTQGAVLGAEQAPAIATAGGGGASAGTSDDQPAPHTATPEPAGPTDTPEPTDTPTVTPTVTPAVDPDTCTFCSQPEFVIDVSAPEFSMVTAQDCWWGTEIEFELSEEASSWVEYDLYGDHETTAVQHGTSGSFVIDTVYPYVPKNILIHAEDAWANHATTVATVGSCYG
jgi:hypothetical protein